LKLHNWYPVYPVKFYLDNDNNLTKDALIDSGADISVVSFEFGENLGFTQGKHEVCSKVMGVGSALDYLIREADIEINDFRFKTRFAWLQDETIDELIIGYQEEKNETHVV